MAHAFNGHTLGQFISDAQRLLVSSREQERELSSLADLLGSDAIQLSRLRVAAAEHRQSIEAMLARLLGQQHLADGAGSKRPRLLIVDDSDGNRDTTAAILEEAGFEVLTAMNGLEGVMLAHLVRPSVILMDVTMPVMNGLEAARLLRASSATQDLKVIAYTARPDLFDGVATKWFADVIVKPAHPEAIVALVHRVVASETRA